jgi:hypothetical protein
VLQQNIDRGTLPGAAADLPVSVNRRLVFQCHHDGDLLSGGKPLEGGAQARRLPFSRWLHRAHVYGCR